MAHDVIADWNYKKREATNSYVSYPMHLQRQSRTDGNYQSQSSRTKGVRVADNVCTRTAVDTHTLQSS